jgi:hypothetical protein
MLARVGAPVILHGANRADASLIWDCLCLGKRFSREGGNGGCDEQRREQLLAEHRVSS